MIQTLIDDYKRRIDTLDGMLKEKNSGSINDEKKFERLRTKQSEYRTFVSELEKIQTQLEKNIDRLLDN